jgi:ribosomal protein S18 acetylase RimI-like enzyme
MSNVVLRDVTPDDAELAAEFIIELATYERLLDETRPEVERLRKDLDSAADPRLYGIFAEVDGAPVGFAAYYLAYSTNRTAWSIHLQDIFVRESHRGQRIGAHLIRALAEVAKRHGYEAVELEVLTWNDGAREFYESHGFTVNRETDKMYLEGDALTKAAL